MIRIIERNEDVLCGDKTLIFLNTAGAAPFRSSKKVFWPSWVLIDNMPGIRRTASHIMMHVALWKGSTKSDFSNVDPMIRQELKGISFGVYSSELSKHFNVEVKDFIWDMIAKAPSLNVVQFNGYYG